MDRISINHQLGLVRVWEGGKGAKQTYFSKRKHGAIAAAFQVAVDYEASLDPEHRIGRHKPNTNCHYNSQSGIIGVHPYSEIKKHFAGWRACWTQEVNGTWEKRSKKFSFFTYGDKALEYAIALRQAMVEKNMKTINGISTDQKTP